jgi:isochorismate synthase
MEFLSIQNIVVFRLPNHKQVQMFSSGDGEAKFIFASFLKNKNAITINGHIKSLDEAELEKIFKTISLSSTKDDVSTLESDYKDLVSLAKDKIKSTNLDKVVLAGKKWISFEIDLYKTYLSLLENNPGAFVYLSSIVGMVMLGASPELLLERKNMELRTVALGGTETRGVYSEKERIEHQQIKDYIELVLKDRMYAYVSHETSSVKASTVSHLKTPYTIEAKSIKEDLNLISGLHPTSAICGLPYQEALNFIKENEGFDRNFYSGYLGSIDENNNFNLFVNLRCAELYQDGVMLYAGAGINAMSSPNDEWVEINNKMQTIAQCLK